MIKAFLCLMLSVGLSLLVAWCLYLKPFPWWGFALYMWSFMGCGVSLIAGIIFFAKDFEKKEADKCKS